MLSFNRKNKSTAQRQEQNLQSSTTSIATLCSIYSGSTITNAYEPSNTSHFSGSQCSNNVFNYNSKNSFPMHNSYAGKELEDSYHSSFSRQTSSYLQHSSDFLRSRSRASMENSLNSKVAGRSYLQSPTRNLNANLNVLLPNTQIKISTNNNNSKNQIPQSASKSQSKNQICKVPLILKDKDKKENNSSSSQVQISQNIERNEAEINEVNKVNEVIVNDQDLSNISKQNSSKSLSSSVQELLTASCLESSLVVASANESYSKQEKKSEVLQTSKTIKTDPENQPISPIYFNKQSVIDFTEKIDKLVQEQINYNFHEDPNSIELPAEFPEIQIDNLASEKTKSKGNSTESVVSVMVEKTEENLVTNASANQISNNTNYNKTPEMSSKSMVLSNYSNQTRQIFEIEMDKMASSTVSHSMQYHDDQSKYTIESRSMKNVDDQNLVESESENNFYLNDNLRPTLKSMPSVANLNQISERYDDGKSDDEDKTSSFSNDQSEITQNTKFQASEPKTVERASSPISIPISTSKSSSSSSPPKLEPPTPTIPIATPPSSEDSRISKTIRRNSESLQSQKDSKQKNLKLMQNLLKMFASEINIWKNWNITADHLIKLDAEQMALQKISVAKKLNEFPVKESLCRVHQNSGSSSAEESASNNNINNYYHQVTVTGGPATIKKPLANQPNPNLDNFCSRLDQINQLHIETCDECINKIYQAKRRQEKKIYENSSTNNSSLEDSGISSSNSSTINNSQIQISSNHIHLNNDRLSTVFFQEHLNVFNNLFPESKQHISEILGLLEQPYDYPRRFQLEENWKDVSDTCSKLCEKFNVVLKNRYGYQTSREVLVRK